MLAGSALTTLGAGLIYTLTASSPSAEWIGYQVLGGIGTGVSLQIPIIVAQGTSRPEDLSSATAIILFFQLLAGAVFISVAQALFANELLASVANNVVGVEPGFVVATGATELREVFAPELLPGILRSYMSGLKDAYTLGIALGGVACLIALGVVVRDNRNLKMEGMVKETGKKEADSDLREREKVKEEVVVV